MLLYLCPKTIRGRVSVLSKTNPKSRMPVISILHSSPSLGFPGQVESPAPFVSRSPSKLNRKIPAKRIVVILPIAKRDLNSEDKQKTRQLPRIKPKSKTLAILPIAEEKHQESRGMNFGKEFHCLSLSNQGSQTIMMGSLHIGIVLIDPILNHFQHVRRNIPKRIKTPNVGQKIRATPRPFLPAHFVHNCPQFTNPTLTSLDHEFEKQIVSGKGFEIFVAHCSFPFQNQEIKQLMMGTNTP